MAENLKKRLKEFVIDVGITGSILGLCWYLSTRQNKQLRNENTELRKRNDELVGENREQARRINKNDKQLAEAIFAIGELHQEKRKH